MRADVAIAGGGVMGCATAYHLLLRDPSIDVVVVERDPSYRRASTVLSDGNVRVQFSLPENIAISQYAMEVLATFAEDMAVGAKRPDPAPRRQGNLFLADACGVAEALEGLERQRAAGCDVVWLEADEIADRFPPYRTVGISGGTFGQGDGSVDPSAVLHGYRDKATALGATFVHGDVERVLVEAGRVSGLRLVSGQHVDASMVLNAAGAWAAGLADTAGVALPVVPVMRTVYVVESAVGAGQTLPSVFLPGGLYVIQERDSTYSMAWSRPDDPVGFDFTFSRAGFEDRIWPELVGVLPSFESLRVRGGWCGLYAVNTLDGNAILGEWPGLAGFYLANGFSGHGFQQCHAVGRYIAELMLGLDPVLDLARLGAGRIVSGEPLAEHAGRII